MHCLHIESIYKHDFALKEDRMISVGTSAKREFAVHYKTTRMNDLDIFYRDADPQDAAVILLLHGFPTAFKDTGLEMGMQRQRFSRVVWPDWAGVRRRPPLRAHR
jgi:hypothetical protein